MRSFLCLVLLCGTALASTPEDATINNDVWVDTDGNRIHAHGGGMLPVKESDGTLTYYWHGTTQKQGSAWLSEGINVYSSQDLQNWQFRGEVFKNTSIQVNYDGPYRIERPKVIYNDQTKLYVMYFHLDTAQFKAGMVGVATSDSPTGQFQWVHGFQPDGQRSLDMTLYKDSTGAYLVRTVNNQFAGFSALTPDYLNTTGIISKGPRVEGQAVFNYDNHYYLWGSHLTGWSANPAVFSESTGSVIKGADWTDLGNPSGSSTTYNSQSTFILPYIHPSGKTMWIYGGDIWNDRGPGSVGNATYLWLPLINHGNGTWQMPFLSSWQIKDF